MSILTLGLVFVAALFVSGIFSMLEAAILSQDRHRLRHLARGEGARKARQAKRMLALLRRPDRLLAVILLCNNLANVLAATVGTVAAVRIFGDAGGTVLGVSLAVTAMLLIFSEILPKMLGLRFAAPVSLFGGAPIAFLLRVLAPLVAALGAIVSVVLGAVGLRAGRILPGGAMTAAELRSVVLESRRFIPPRHGEAIVRLLNLQNTTVEEIMTPRFAIESIDISRSPRAIANQIRNARFWRLPVHRGDIDSGGRFFGFALRAAPLRPPRRDSPRRDTANPARIAAGAGGRRHFATDGKVPRARFRLRAGGERIRAHAGAFDAVGFHHRLDGRRQRAVAVFDLCRGRDYRGKRRRAVAVFAGAVGRRRVAGFERSENFERIDSRTTRLFPARPGLPCFGQNADGDFATRRKRRRPRAVVGRARERRRISRADLARFVNAGFAAAFFEQANLVDDHRAVDRF